MKQKNEKKLDTWKIALLITLIFVTFMYLWSSFELKNTTQDKEYYKEQMITFCEITKLQENILELSNIEIPKMEEDCEHYILSWDKND